MRRWGTHEAYVVVHVDAPRVTVAVTVTNDGGGGVTYADVDVEVAALVIEFDVVFEAVALASAWKAEKECGFGSAGALIANTIPRVALEAAASRARANSKP